MRLPGRRTIPALSLAFSLLAPAAARGTTAPPPVTAPPPAAPAPDPAAGGQRFVGLTLEAGQYAGFGLGVRAGHPRAGALLSGTWVPTLAAVASGPGGLPELRFFSSLQANVGAYALLLRTSARASIGATADYRYNTALGHGGALGFYAHIDFSRHLGLHVLAGAALYPAGAERLRARSDVPDGADFGFPGPSFVYGGNLGLVFFP